MSKLIAMLMLAAAMASPAHAFEVGDPIKFRSDQSPGCALLEDAKQAPWNGTASQKKEFANGMTGEGFYTAMKTMKKTPSLDEWGALVRKFHVCQIFFGNDAFVSGFDPYRVAEKADGYVCVDTYDPKGQRTSAACLWTRESEGN